MNDCIAIENFEVYAPCKNGFPMTGACLGGIKGGTPKCCDEEWCGRIYNDNGGKPATKAEREAS